MAKYIVDLGGFVSVFRCRKITVYADNEAEAIEKATDKWYEVQQQVAGNMCGDPTVNSIEIAEGRNGRN